MEGGTTAQSRDFGFEFNRFIRGLCYAGVLALLCFFLFIMLGCLRISSCAFYTYNSYTDIPAHSVGLLLGTSSNVAPGQPNDFFTNRIMAAASLYHKGKIEYILVSGDNRHPSYNEPRMMMNALLKAGVPLDRIVPDYAGFSTIDSVLRARHVFMLNDMIIISQDFHNERAIFIARANGIDAVGFNASNPTSFTARFRVGVREFFARIKCVFDVYLLNSRPTYLGDPIAIGNRPLPRQPTDKPKRPTSKPKQPGMSVQGLRQLQQLHVAVRAKEPGDSALILKQRRLAVEAFQQTLLHEDEEDGADAPLQHQPMASPLDLPRSMIEDQPRSRPARSAAAPAAAEQTAPQAAPAPRRPAAQRPQPADPARHSYGDPWE